MIREGMKPDVFSSEGLMTTIILFLLLVFSPAYALVDYSDFSGKPNNPAPAPQAAPAQRAPEAPAPTIPTQVTRREAPRAQNFGTHGSHFNFSIGYEQLDVNDDVEQGKLNLTQVQLHFQTRFDVFIRSSFWRGETEAPFLSESSAAQNGNPTAIIGFNWLKFGAPRDLAAVDLYVGGVFGSSSELAHSRTDRLAGVETSKRFGDFLIGAGYEYRMTGAPKNDQELGLGAIQKISGTVGWRATPDIQFLVEGSAITISPDKGERSSRLQEEIRFGTVTPKIGLGLREFIQLELGARFQTRKSNNPADLIGARLWDIGGSNGNSLFTSINIVI
jgi:hypothetical protein